MVSLRSEARNWKTSAPPLPFQRVISALTSDGVIAAATLKKICSITAIDHISAATTFYSVSTTASLDDVRATVAFDVVALHHRL